MEDGRIGGILGGGTDGGIVIIGIDGIIIGIPTLDLSRIDLTRERQCGDNKNVRKSSIQN